MLAEAIGLNGDTAINPSGGPLASNPVMSAGLVRNRRSRPPDLGG